MPLRLWKCKECGEEFKTKSDSPEHCSVPSEMLITSPSTKFMEKIDSERGKSALVGQQKMLKERSRAHSRDVETDDLAQRNGFQESVRKGWVKEDGTRRKAIDDK